MATIQKRERKGGVIYKVVIRVKGYPTQSQSFRRLTDARAWAEKTENAIRDGQYKSVGAEARRKTVADIIIRYRSDVLPNKAESTQRVEKTFLKFWEAQLGTYTLPYITPDLVSEKLRELSEAGDTRHKSKDEQQEIKPKNRKTLKHYRDTLELLFKYAVQWGWTATNPVNGVNRITKLRNERTRYLSDEERQTLLEACKASDNAQLYPLVVFALSTGSRKGEALGLIMDDLDLKRGVAIFRNTKNGDTRSVPIVGHLREVMRRHIADAIKFYQELDRKPPKRWVFPREDGQAPIDIRAAWESARDKAGLIDFRFHDLRHSTASYLAMNGASQLEIAEVLGHRTLQMVKRYAHLSESHVKGLLENLDERLF